MIHEAIPITPDGEPYVPYAADAVTVLPYNPNGLDTEGVVRTPGRPLLAGRRVRPVTENQKLVTVMPASTSIFSNTHTWSKNRSYSSSAANPITRSTPAR